MPFSEDVRSRLDADAVQIIGKYPRPRSALLPLLHLVQSEEGFVSADGIAYCAAKFGLTEAEVTAVVSFYTMYKRRPVGEYHVGVCTNTLCAVMGGDQIFAELTEHLGIGNDETTPDGKVNLEHIECNAACDYAPIMTVNWEFFDNMTPATARQLVDDLRAGNQVSPTRGPSRLCTWKQASRILAGFGDGQATEGPTAGPASLVGLTIAHERGWTAPHPADTSGNGAPHAGAGSSAGSGPAGSGVSPADSSSPRPGKSPEPGQPPAAGKSPRPRGSARSRSAGQKSPPGASESPQPEQESP
jgi:NADH-quinone oxidoreductase subunit E